MLLRKCSICKVVYGCMTHDKRAVCEQCPDDHDCKCRDNLLLLGDDYMTTGISLGCEDAPQETSPTPSPTAHEVIHS